MRHRWAYLPEQVHAQGGDLSGRNRAVSSRALQQYFGPQGELSGLVRLRAARRTGLRKRRKRLQVHVSDEAAYLWVRRRSASAITVVNEDREITKTMLNLYLVYVRAEFLFRAQ